MTSFEVRYSLQDKNGVWWLDRASTTTEYTRQEIMTEQCGDFIHRLLAALFATVAEKPEIELLEPDKTKFGSHFDEREEKLIIYIWVGEEEPKVEIVKSEYAPNMGQLPSGSVLSGWCYYLSQGSQFLVRSPTTFLYLINQYLKDCSEQDHQEFLSGESRLKILVELSETHSPPVVAVYLVRKKDSSERLLVEFVDPENRTQYFEIDRKKCETREILTQEDVRLHH